MIADAQDGQPVLTTDAGHNPRWRLISALVAESPDGRGYSVTDQGYRIDYIPANRGQLDATTNYVAVSDLHTTRVGTLPSINRWTYANARDPRLSPQLDHICLRSPETGDLRIVKTETGAAAPAMGAGDDARWAVDGSAIVWAWSGRVYGRDGVNGPTVDLTPPGRQASQPVPLRDRATGRLYVGMVLATTGNAGDLVITHFASLPMEGYVVASSAGSAFDWDLFSPGDGTIRVVYRVPVGSPALAQVDLSRPMTPITATWPWVEPVTPTNPRIFAWFYSHGRYGDFTPEANATILSMRGYTDNGVLPSDAQSRYCTALDNETGFISVEDIGFQAVRDRWASVRGVMVHEPSTVQQAKEMVAEARQTMATHQLPPRPVIAVIAIGQAVDVGYRHTGADALAPEIYFDEPSPTYDEMLARAHRMLDEVQIALSGVPLYLVAQAYDRSRVSWQQHPTQLAAIAEACASRLNSQQVLGLWPFAYARPGGATTYPELGTIYAEQAAVMTAPPLPVDPPPNPPDPNPEDEMYYPNDSQMINSMQRIADAYVNVLKRVPPPSEQPPQGDGIYRVPPDGMDVSIPDHTRPNTRIDTKSIAVWIGRYFNYFNQYQGDHERSINQVLSDIRNSPEGQAANPQ